MKEIIPFKKDIIFKTKIAKVTDISLTHDYKVIDNMIEGDFLLSGSYKMTEASVLNEEFIYNIPFSISISDRIDNDTVNLMLHDFKYEIKEDVMSIKIELELNCKEKEEVREEIEDIKEEVREIETTDKEIEDIIEEVIDASEEEERNFNMPEVDITPTDIKEVKETKQSIMALTEKVKESKEFVKYKVYIVREDDTVEKISAKYNVTVNDLRDYNDIDTISIGDKIVIPYIENE